MKDHNYEVKTIWTGDRGKGTKNFLSYERMFDQVVDGKPIIEGSSDPAFRGDPSRYNPEDLLVASVASCHMLWYLHLCSVNGISVRSYVDMTTGRMQVNSDGSGQFESVTLNPNVEIMESNKLALASSLHEKVGDLCFIARSVNFPILHNPVISLHKTN